MSLSYTVAYKWVTVIDAVKFEFNDKISKDGPTRTDTRNRQIVSVVSVSVFFQNRYFNRYQKKNLPSSIIS